MYEYSTVQQVKDCNRVHSLGEGLDEFGLLEEQLEALGEDLVDALEVRVFREPLAEDEPADHVADGAHRERQRVHRRALCAARTGLLDALEQLREARADRVLDDGPPEAQVVHHPQREPPVRHPHGAIDLADA